MRLFRHPIVRLAVTIISLILVYNLSLSIIDLWTRKDIVSSRRGALALVEQKNAQLKEKLSVAQSPEFVEKQAREKLGMVKPGETLVLVGTDGSGDPVTAKPRKIPNWQMWWRLFIGD